MNDERYWIERSFEERSDCDRVDELIDAYSELCPMGRRILLYIADRLVFGVRTHGPWKPRSVKRIDKLEEIGDSMIYAAVEAIEDVDDEGRP